MTLDRAARDLAGAVLASDGCTNLHRLAGVVLRALERRRKAGAESGRKSSGPPRRWRAVLSAGIWAAVDGRSGDVVATFEVVGGRVRQLSGLKNVTAQRVVRAAARARSAAVLARAPIGGAA